MPGRRHPVMQHSVFIKRYLLSSIHRATRVLHEPEKPRFLWIGMQNINDMDYQHRTIS